MKEGKALASILTVSHITHRFGRTPLLQDVSLMVAAGEAAVLTGANGSGKSTLVRIIAGLLRPQRGQVTFAPHLIWQWCPDSLPLEAVSTRTFLTECGMISALPAQVLRQQISTLADTFQLTPYLETPLSHLSKGNRQKAALIQALLGQPQLLLLDEPLSGIDKDARPRIIQYLQDYRAAGGALVVIAHEPAVIQQLGTTVYRLHDGVLSKEAAAAPRYRIRFAPTAAAQPLPHGWSAPIISVPAADHDHALAVLIAQGYTIMEVRREN